MVLSDLVHSEYVKYNSVHLEHYGRVKIMVGNISNSSRDSNEGNDEYRKIILKGAEPVQAIPGNGKFFL